MLGKVLSLLLPQLSLHGFLWAVNGLSVVSRQSPADRTTHRKALACLCHSKSGDKTKLGFRIQDSGVRTLRNYKNRQQIAISN